MSDFLWRHPVYLHLVDSAILKKGKHVLLVTRQRTFFANESVSPIVTFFPCLFSTMLTVNKDVYIVIRFICFVVTTCNCFQVIKAFLVEGACK